MVETFMSNLLFNFVVYYTELSVSDNIVYVVSMLNYPYKWKYASLIIYHVYI